MISELVAESLEDLDMDAAPPCEMILSRARKCGNPAVIRLYVSCPLCHKEGYTFLCQHCYHIVRTPDRDPAPHCMQCGNYDFTWSIT